MAATSLIVLHRRRCCRYRSSWAGSARFSGLSIFSDSVFSGAMPLIYVSPTQINAQVPADAFFPPCNQGSGSVYFTSIQITTPSGGQTAMVSATPTPAPGLFTANETGRGVAAAQFVTNLPDGTQTIMDVAECPGGTGTCVPVPLNVTAGNSALVLWGTGISEYSSFPQGLTVMAGNQPLEVFYAGALAAISGFRSDQCMSAVKLGRERDGEPERDAVGDNTGIWGLHLSLCCDIKRCDDRHRIVHRLALKLQRWPTEESPSQGGRQTGCATNAAGGRDTDSAGSEFWGRGVAEISFERRNLLDHWPPAGRLPTTIWRHRARLSGFATGGRLRGRGEDRRWDLVYLIDTCPGTEVR